jgi:hypothetical protein
MTSIYRWPVLLLFTALMLAASPSAGQPASRPAASAPTSAPTSAPATVAAVAKASADLDYPGTIVLGRALLRRGVSGPKDLEKTFELMAYALIVVKKPGEAQQALRRLLALNPAFKVDTSLSPKLRRPVADMLARWAGRPGLTVTVRPPAASYTDAPMSLRAVVVEDPAQMAREVRLLYRLPADKQHRRIRRPVAKSGAATFELPLPSLGATPGKLLYVVELLDEHGNVLVRRGVGKEAMSIKLALRPKTVDEAALDAKELARLRRRKRRTLGIWGYTTLGVGAATLAAAGIVYAVAVVQGDRAHDKYVAAPADDTDAILRHRADVEAAENKLIVGHVLAGVGVAAVGVAVYLLWTRPRATAERPKATGPSVQLLPTLGGASLRARF